MQLNKLILLTCLGMVVYFSCVIYAQPQIDPRIHQGTFPTSAKPVPKDMKGVKKYTKEEYEQKTGRKLVDDNPYGEEEYKDPDVILEYDYECFEGKCEYVSGLRILVLGGTQFLGRLIIDDLIKNELTSVTMLNRGVSANPFAASSQVKHIKVDRLYDSEGLKKELKELTYHDVVIDLTGLHGIHLVDIVQNFQGKCGHYIYVSCANVYYFDEGSQTLRKERAFTIPEEASIEAIQLQEKYGNELMLAQGKLTAENLLLQVHKEHEFPITIIRLPDVVGPYDNKGRHLAVHLSIQRGQPIGGANHKNMKDKFSVVYGPDVVAAINATITAAEKTYGKIINIAGDEQLTFTEYVGHLSKALGKKASFEPRRQSLLPSIYSGPLDNTLAKELLNWKPTPIEDWMPKLVEFFSQDENVDYTAKILMRAQEDARKARN